MTKPISIQQSDQSVKSDHEIIADLLEENSSKINVESNLPLNDYVSEDVMVNRDYNDDVDKFVRKKSDANISNTNNIDIEQQLQKKSKASELILHDDNDNLDNTRSPTITKPPEMNLDSHLNQNNGHLNTVLLADTARTFEIKQKSPQSDEVTSDDDDDEVEDYAPSEDVYTMLFVAPVLTPAFLYAMFIFSLQILILALFVINLLSKSSKINPFVVPLRSAPELVFGQIIALLVTVFTATDVTESLDILHVRYDPDVENDFPWASKRRWLLTRLLRFSEGVFSIFVAFIFIVQSRTNLDLFLNFAAVQFVSELDDMAFFVADQGYSIIKLKRMTANIKEKLKFKNQPRESQKHHWIKNLTILSLVVLTLGGFFVINIEQEKGFFFEDVCHQFWVRFPSLEYDFFTDVCENFDDCPASWKERSTPLRYSGFSDVYTVKRKENGEIFMRDGRPIFFQRGESDFNAFGEASPPGVFSYCHKERAWVFTIENVSKGQADMLDDSCNWLMKSPPTTEFNLQKVTTDGWILWTGILEVAKPLVISCAQCDDSRNIGEFNVGCTYHGKCVNKHCQCDPHWMSHQCETCVACTSMTLSTAARDWEIFRLNTRESEDDSLAKAFDIYGHPVYYNGHVVNGTIFIDKGVLVLFYTGSSFTIWSMGHLVEERTDDLEVLRSALVGYHASWGLDGHTPIYVSERTTVPMPFGLKWRDLMTGEDDVAINFVCPEEEQKFCSFVFN